MKYWKTTYHGCVSASMAVSQHPGTDVYILDISTWMLQNILWLNQDKCEIFVVGSNTQIETGKKIKVSRTYPELTSRSHQCNFWLGSEFKDSRWVLSPNLLFSILKILQMWSCGAALWVLIDRCDSSLACCCSPALEINGCDAAINSNYFSLVLMPLRVYWQLVQ